MNHKWTVFIIITIVVVAGIGGYLLFAKNVQAPGSPSGNSTSTALVSTYGMTQFESVYGFSFWYPSALTVTATQTNDAVSFPGGIAIETVQIGPAGGTSVVVVNAPSSTITDEPANHASPIAQTEYSYDDASGQWMVSYPQGTTDGSSAATAPADVSNTTVGGLIMLPSGKRFDTSIIPLSKTMFLVVSDGGGSSFTSQLAKTITQTGATIDASTLSTVLQAESTAWSMMSPAPVATTTPVTTSPSLSPQSGAVGTTVTIHGNGFTSDNTIEMNGLIGESMKDIASPDGKTLTFTVPSSLGPNCQPNQACPQFLMLVSPNVYTISVVTNGVTQNIGTFTVTAK